MAPVLERTIRHAGIDQRHRHAARGGSLTRLGRFSQIPRFGFQCCRKRRTRCAGRPARTGACISQAAFHQRRRRDCGRDQNVDIRPRRQHRPIRVSDDCASLAACTQTTMPLGGSGRASHPFGKPGLVLAPARQTPLEMRGNQRAAGGRQGAVDDSQPKAARSLHAPRGVARPMPGHATGRRRRVHASHRRRRQTGLRRAQSPPLARSCVRSCSQMRPRSIT